MSSSLWHLQTISVNWQNKSMWVSVCVYICVCLCVCASPSHTPLNPHNWGMSTDSCDNTDTEDLRRSSTQPRSNLWSMLSRPAPDVQKKMFLCNAIQSLHRPESHDLIYKIQRMPEVIDESESLDNPTLLLDKCDRTTRRAQSSKNTAGLRLSVFSTFNPEDGYKEGSKRFWACEITLWNTFALCVWTTWGNTGEFQNIICVTCHQSADNSHMYEV